MPEHEGIGFRYAALVFSPPNGPSTPFVMYGGKETFEGKILSLVPESEHERWRAWIGSVAWDKIDRAERIVIARVASPRPGVALDADDLRLLEQMRTAWAAFLLTGASHSSDPWVISGEAAGDRIGSPPLTLASAQPQDGKVHPFYMQRPGYIEVAYRKQWEATHGKPDESWFWLWVEVDELLTRRTLRPAILGYALLSYYSALRRSLLEFSIPEFVRAVEGVIALPFGRGRYEFRDRALQIVPSLRSDKYVRENIEALLVRLYELRNDCVHGKLPFRDMEARGEEGQDEAAQLSYAAEVLARETLLLALRHPDWSVFESREVLEGAWEKGAFPPG